MARTSSRRLSALPLLPQKRVVLRNMFHTQGRGPSAWTGVNDEQKAVTAVLERAWSVARGAILNMYWEAHRMRDAIYINHSVSKAGQDKTPTRKRERREKHVALVLVGLCLSLQVPSVSFFVCGRCRFRNFTVKVVVKHMCSRRVPGLDHTQS